MCVQDIMRLDNASRMNFPGTVEKNWTWRIGGEDIWEQLKPEAKDLHTLLASFDRLAPSKKTTKP